MSTNQFLTFQKFNSLEDAQGLIDLLKENGIKVQVVDASPQFDITFANNTIHNEIKVKIQKEDFATANQVVEENASLFIEEVPADHYLFEFDDTELLEIVEKADEWSKEDYLLALKILKDRGKEVSKEEVTAIYKKRLDELTQPEKGDIKWLIFGFGSAFLGGFLGLFIGWFHWKFKKTAPNAQRFYAYDEETRKTGKLMFWTGVISSIVWIILIINHYS